MPISLADLLSHSKIRRVYKSHKNGERVINANISVIRLLDIPFLFVELYKRISYLHCKAMLQKIKGFGENWLCAKDLFSKTDVEIQFLIHIMELPLIREGTKGK